jgi:hypothetical protein
MVNASTSWVISPTKSIVRRKTSDPEGEIPPLTSFRLPEGIMKRGNSFFDPTEMLGDHLTAKSRYNLESLKDEANERLAIYGYEPISKDDIDIIPSYIASEVGDDEETASNSKAFIAIQLVFHRLFGMKESVEDTSINSRYGNFAEDLIILPDGYGQTYLSARNTSSFNSMSFIDIPKLRLAIDIRPMRMDHSGTNDGKAQMIGSRQRWIPLESGFRGQYEIFNLFQDVNLGLHRDRKFPYLPQALGGYGKEPPFRNSANLERFMKAFKQGSHSELIRNIVRRTSDYLEKRSRHEYPAKDPLLSHCVRYQSSFHDWVKGRTIYAPVTWIDVPPEVAKFRAGKHGESPVKDEVILRLLSEKRLLTEQQLEIAVEHNELCRALLGATNIKEFKSLRDEARMRFNNFSLFSQESYGMIKELTLDQSRSKEPLSQEEVKVFNERVMMTRGGLRFIVGEEYVYWPEAMDMIYKVGPMKVRFDMFPKNKIGTRSLGAQRSEFKSDYEDTEDLHKLDHLEEWLRSSVDSPPTDTTLINDDESIISKCSRTGYNIIVTDDKRLCKEANRRTRNPVFRVPCSWYYKSIYFGSESWTDVLSQVRPGIEWAQYEDTGSLKSFEENYFHDGVMLRQKKVQKFNIWKTTGVKDQYTIVEDDDYEGYSKSLIHLLIYDAGNVLRFGRKKGHGPNAPRRRPQ